MAAHYIRFSGSLLSGTALALCLSTGAIAQNAEPLVLGTILLSGDPSEVRERDENGAAADRSGAVYVADAELERARMGDVKDLFAGVASVSVGGAISVAQKIFVNGVDMLNLSVQLDGAQQNNRAFHHTTANAFDPGLMKSVRVDPGIAAADIGPNAVAGAVIMETVDAADVLDDGDNFGGNLRLSYGDNGGTFSRALTLAGRQGGFEFLGYAKVATGSDFHDGADNAMTGTAADLTSGLLKLAYESDGGHRLEFSAQQMEDTALRNFRANFGPSGTLVRYNTVRSNYSLSYHMTNGSGWWDPKAVLGFSESIVNAPLYTDSQGTSNTLTAKLQNTFHLANLGTVVAGADLTNKASHYQSTGVARKSEKTSNFGLFVQARLEPTERLDFSAGLRADWQKLTGTDASTNSVSGVSGNVSVVYDLTDNLSLRAGYSNVFGGHQLEDNYLYFRTWNYAALETSRAENYVIGVDWDNGRLSLGAEAFLTSIDGARSGDANIDFESKGYNLKATYGWDSGFARLTFAHSDLATDGVSPDSYAVLDFGAPLGDVLALTVQQEISKWNMVVGGDVAMALDYDHAPVASYPTQSFEGYTAVNVFAEYNPPAFKNLTIRGEVQNLFDQDYADRATYGGDYPGFATLHEPGRTFLVSVTTRF